MPRIVPATPLANPNQTISASLWNTQGPKAMSDFYTGPPIFRGRSNATVSTANNVWVAMPLQVSEIDSDSGHSNVTNNTRYTCQVAGWYLICGLAAWTNSAAAAGKMDCAVWLNGALVPTSMQSYNKQASDFGSVNTETFLQLAVNDYIEIQGRQATGSTINTQIGTDLCPLMNVFWIHS